MPHFCPHVTKIRGKRVCAYICVPSVNPLRSHRHRLHQKNRPTIAARDTLVFAGNGHQFTDDHVFGVAEVIGPRRDEGRRIELIGLETVQPAPEVSKRDRLLLTGRIDCPLFHSIPPQDGHSTLQGLEGAGTRQVAAQHRQTLPTLLLPTISARVTRGGMRLRKSPEANSPSASAFANMMRL